MPCLHPNRILTAAFLAIAPTLPVFAQDAPERLSVVYIGDSSLPEAMQVYAARIETDFGVDVFFTQRNTSLVNHARRVLESGAWNIVGEAEFVVVGIRIMNDRPGYCTDQPGDTPIRWPLEEVPPMIDGFVQALADIADPETQVVRIALDEVLPDDLDGWSESGHLTECIDVLMGINTAWATSAERHGFTIVDNFSAWNGPDGLAQPPRTFYQTDGRHFTDEGARAAADLLLETGYHPLEP